MMPGAATPYLYRAYGFNVVSDMPLVQLLPGIDPTLDTIEVRRCDVLPPMPEDAKPIGPYAFAGRDYLSLTIDDGCPTCGDGRQHAAVPTP